MDKQKCLVISHAISIMWHSELPGKSPFKLQDNLHSSSHSEEHNTESPLQRFKMHDVIKKTTQHFEEYVYKAPLC